MSIALIFEVLMAAFKFPAELSAFIKLISKSPEEKRQAIMLEVGKWAEESSGGERPKWEV